MKRATQWAPWLVLLAVAVGALVVGAHRSSHPSLDSRVMHIAGEVRCPVCQGETAAQSQVAASVQIRDQIRRDLLAGENENQILADMVRAYGVGILEKPQARGVSLLVWVLPVVGLGLGAAGLAVAFVRWRSRGAHEAGGGDVGMAPGALSAGSGAGAEPDSPPAPLPAPLTPRSLLRRWRRMAVATTGVLLITGGASWAVAASSGTRLPGQAITGAALDSEVVAQHLQRAQQDANKGDDAGALREYQTVLDSNPEEPQALTGEGWLLALTGQPSLLSEGLKLLVSAEQANPTYAPAHLYRGLALLSEDDYQGSIPEMQWYLAHDPDPQLAPKVRTALRQAQAKAKAAGAGG